MTQAELAAKAREEMISESADDHETEEHGTIRALPSPPRGYKSAPPPQWDDLDVDPADVNEALAVNAAEWREELPLIEEWFEFVGEKLPTGIKDEFDALKHRLAEAD